MSFRSDASFPERQQDDLRPMPSVGRSQRGEVYARIKERDIHELWALSKDFIRAYGIDAFEDVMAEVRGQ